MIRIDLHSLMLRKQMNGYLIVIRHKKQVLIGYRYRLKKKKKNQ